MFSSVRTPRVYEHIVAQIERAIYESRLQQGDKLPPERELVRQFSASRVAVREALRALEHRGFVEVRQGSAGGYFIREVDSGPLMRDSAARCCQCSRKRTQSAWLTGSISARRRFTV